MNIIPLAILILSNSNFMLPLEGIKVIDLTQAVAGPVASLMLADLGAEVIKVEPPEGDMSRSWHYSINFKGKATSSFFISLNRNKRSIVLDLTKQDDRKTFEELVKTADVIVENYSLEASRKLGLEYDRIKKLNEQLILCSIRGFSKGSIYEERPAFDLIIQGMSGLMSVTGTERGEYVRVGTPIIDITTGLVASIAILVALYQRRLTGRGQWIEIPLMDVGVFTMSIFYSYYLMSGINPRPMGTKQNITAPYQAFKCKDGKFVILAAGNDRLWRRLCKVMGYQELAEDPRFSSVQERVRNLDVIEGILSKKFIEKTRDEWIKILNENQIPCGPLYTLDEAINDPYIKGLIFYMDHDEMGKVVGIKNPIKSSEFKVEARVAPPLLDEHREEILKRLKWNRG
jgi:crotonobetainyl-CoA:carnitine CoA-transferase CaiB-like acyl-CoA transferase